MLKFLHLSDLHLVPPGVRLHGLIPQEQLDRCVDDVIQKHSQAAFCVVTGDLTHGGDPIAYGVLRECLARLPMPVHLMLGNHDDRKAFREAFPNVPTDSHGFVQQAISTTEGRLLLLDTSEIGMPDGRLCERRLAWLKDRIEEQPESLLFLFLHHPPFRVGLQRMDSIRLLNGDILFEVLRPHLSRIRHFFVGHLHRMIAGSWRGIPFSGVRGTSHQIELDFKTSNVASVSFDSPGYGVVMVSSDSTIVHFEEISRSVMGT